MSQDKPKSRDQAKDQSKSAPMKAQPERSGKAEKSGNKRDAKKRS